MKPANVIYTFLLLAVVGGAPFIIHDAYLIHIGIMIFLGIVVALSMNLMLKLGQLTLAHGAFFGLGAYASALFVMRLQLPFPVAFLLAGGSSALMAAIFGPVFLRVKGVYFALLTFAFGQVLNLIFQEWVDLFGGNNGLFGIPKPNIFGLRIVTPQDFYFFTFILATAVYLFIVALYKSRIGSIIAALDESEPLSQSFGLNPLAWRTAMFVVSSFIVGLAGSVYAHYVGIISPEAFTFWVVVDALVINVVGGLALPIGSVIGAVLLVPLPELLRDTQQFQKLLFGIIVMLALIFLPQGVISLKRIFRSK